MKSLMAGFEETKCISVGFSCQDIFCVNEGWIFAKKKNWRTKINTDVDDGAEKKVFLQQQDYLHSGTKLYKISLFWLFYIFLSDDQESMHWQWHWHC